MILSRSVPYTRFVLVSASPGEKQRGVNVNVSCLNDRIPGFHFSNKADNVLQNNFLS